MPFDIEKREIAFWDGDIPPYCGTCGCGGNWHYPECPIGIERGDTIVVVNPPKCFEWLLNAPR